MMSDSDLDTMSNSDVDTMSNSDLDKTSDSDLDPVYDLRKRYSRFRILVIGRANAGKTTLLQKVCNTTEDPCIYDENDQNLASVP